MRRILLLVAALFAGISANQATLEGGTPPRPASAEPAVILTPKPSPAPHVDGPRLYGCRPVHPFLYPVPLRTRRPMW